MRALILIVCLLFALPALAVSSPVGVWRLDEASLDQAIDRLVEGVLQAVPEEDRAAAQAELAAQRDAMRDEMTSSLAATFDFRPDGTVVITDPDQAEPDHGTWRMEGDHVHVVDDDPDSPDLVGLVQEHRIELGFEVDQNDPEEAALAGMNLVLVPAR